jgi:hypothetical protein
MTVTQTRLKELLIFDEASDTWTWRIQRRGSGRAGEFAGHTADSGAHRIRVDGKIYDAKRLKYLWLTGEWLPWRARLSR